MMVVPVPTDVCSIVPARIVIRSVTGEPIKIKVRNLWESEKQTVLKAFRFIDERLTDENYREEVRVAMHSTGICATETPGVCMTVPVGDAAAMILTRKLFNVSQSWSFDEFAVTVLHELLHAFESEFHSADSEKEARHDITAYVLLGLRISRAHWAFSKYPNLLDEIRSAE